MTPPLKMKNKVGHTSSTILNSCSFKRYRLSFRNLYSILLKQTLPLVENLPGKFYGKLLAPPVCLCFPCTLVIQLVLTSSTWIVFEKFILFAQRSIWMMITLMNRRWPGSNNPLMKSTGFSICQKQPRFTSYTHMSRSSFPCMVILWRCSQMNP